MTTSIVKQLLINNLKIDSVDILEKVKSYCFYDKKTWETMCFIRDKKEKINYLLNNFTISRANPLDYFDDDADNDEHWMYWILDNNDGPNIQFQGINCKICGNYITISRNNVPNNIKCICPINDYHFDDDDIWEMMGTDIYDSDDDMSFDD